MRPFDSAQDWFKPFHVLAFGSDMKKYSIRIIQILFQPSLRVDNLPRLFKESVRGACRVREVVVCPSEARAHYSGTNPERSRGADDRRSSEVETFTLA